MSGPFDLGKKTVSDGNLLVEKLYSEHNLWLHRWLIKQIGCREHAADITQDTFVRILKSRDALFSIREPRAYLTRVAKNLWMDGVRRKKLEQAYLDELIAVGELCEGQAPPQALLEVLQALEQISQALSHLPQKVRQTFLLHYLEGKTQKEVAQELGVSVRTVRNYLAQCLIRVQRLAAELNNE